MDIGNFLASLVASEELRWLLVTIAGGTGTYFFWNAYAKNHLSTRAQLDSRFDALINAQASFTNEWQERYEKTQKRLDEEREYGKKLDAKNVELRMQLAEMRGELNVLKQQLGMFIACPSPECPFKSIRDTMH